MGVLVGVEVGVDVLVGDGVNVKVEVAVGSRVGVAVAVGVGLGVGINKLPQALRIRLRQAAGSRPQEYFNLSNIIFLTSCGRLFFHTHIKDCLVRFIDPAAVPFKHTRHTLVQVGELRFAHAQVVRISIDQSQVLARIIVPGPGKAA